MMRWEDERYIRLYTRDTIEWEMSCWQARALMPQILRKVDRAGLLELGSHGARGIAKCVKLPLDVVQPGLDGTDDGPGLLTNGSIEIRGTLLVIPNFIDAQETPSSDAQRKRDQRERAMAHARLSELDDSLHSSHTPSRVVTGGHSVPSVPSRTKPSVPTLPEAPSASRESGLGGKPNEATKRVVDRWRSVAESVLDALNVARKRVQSNSRGISPSYDSLKHIADRLEAGKSVEDCLHVVEVCEAECTADAGSFKWFDAVTPFRPVNFERKSAAPVSVPGRSSMRGPAPVGDFSGVENGVDVAHMLRRT